MAAAPAILLLPRRRAHREDVRDGARLRQSHTHTNTHIRTQKLTPNARKRHSEAHVMHKKHQTMPLDAVVTRQSWSVLAVSTLAFTVCFMVWMMFGVIGIPIKKMLNLNATQFGLLTAVPVLTGSLIRVPLGIWTDRYGGRIVMTVLMASTVPAIWIMGYATEYWHFLVIGLFVGLAGGSFSVGTPYVARWFPKNRQGMAMGIYGAGNSGSAVNKFVAPVLLVAFGWAV